MMYPSSEFEENKTYMLHTDTEVVEGRSMFLRTIRKKSDRTVFHPVSDWTFYDSVSLSDDGYVRILRMEKDNVIQRELDGFVEMDGYDMIILLSHTDRQTGVRVFHPRIEMYAKYSALNLRLRSEDSDDMSIKFRRNDQGDVEVKNNNPNIVLSRSTLYNHWLDDSYEDLTHLFWVNLPVNNIEGIEMKSL